MKFQYKASPARERRAKGRIGKVLLDVSGDQFGHFEHADLALPVKNWFERIVRIDHGPLFLVLASIFLDVIPELLGELRARKWFGPDNRGELFVGLNGSHEGRIRFTFRRRFFGFGFRHEG